MPGQQMWSRRPPPRPDHKPSTVWGWELRTSGDLTASRRELHAKASPSAESPGHIEEGLERLLLAYEELSSNGLRHGHGPVHASVTAFTDGWLIDVTDNATERSPTPAVDRDPALGGLGLYLISELSSAHGWTVQGGRKHVWALITLGQPRNEPATPKTQQA